MRWELDLEADALYVYLANGVPARQHEMPDGVVVDVTADDAVVGIDVPSVSAGFNWTAIADEFHLGDDDRLSLAGLAAFVVDQMIAGRVPAVTTQFQLA